jgi:hypothetical protein
MRTIGRWSIASVINFVVSLFSFAAMFGALFGICILLAVPFVRLPIVVTAPVSFTLDTPDQILGGRTGWNFEFREGRRPPAPRPARLQRIDGSMRVPSTSRWFIAANGIGLISLLVLVAATLNKLRAVLRTLIVDKQPFVAANAARIRWIGLAVIVGDIAWTTVVYAENLYARTHVPIPGVTFDALPQISVWTIILGLLILVIAEVFRAGTRLDEEQSLTI